MKKPSKEESILIALGVAPESEQEDDMDLGKSAKSKAVKGMMKALQFDNEQEFSKNLSAFVKACSYDEDDSMSDEE